MHIVYLVERIDVEGGIQRSLSIRVNGMIEKYGHEVTIVCMEKISGIPVYRINPRVKLVFLDDFKKSNSIFIRISKRWLQSIFILKTLKPDILISVKYSLHNFFFKMYASRVLLVSEIREPFELYNMPQGSSLKFKLNGLIRDFVLKRQDLVITLTNADKEKWGYTNIEVVPNPKTLVTSRLSNLESPQVLAVGRLHRVKGFDKLLEVWNIVHKNHKGWCLKICGAGEEYESLLKKIKELGISDSVKLENRFVSVLPEYMNSSIFVSTSQYEAFGNVLVEAKLCGLPIIAFDAPHGPKEIIEDNVDGFLVEMNNIELMADKVLELICDQKLRSRMGRAGVKNSSKYDVDKILERYNSILMQHWQNR